MRREGERLVVVEDPEPLTQPLWGRLLSMVTWHQPVMVQEVLHYLNPNPGAIIIDGTVGTGGHSLMVLPHLLPDGRLLAIDHDQESLLLARKRLAEFEPQVTCLHGNFRHIPILLRKLGISRVDGLLLDLGMSSVQVDRPERGFSFSKEGPLDMRMDSEQDATAATLLNTLTADELTVVLETLGEERFARRIAHCIVQARRVCPIATTTQLARLVIQAIPSHERHGRLHAATRTFQALRLAVNDELGALRDLLQQLPTLLNPGARAVILTFHSLEDRLVKQAFLQGMRDQRWTILTKKPVRPSRDEVVKNVRARSAKLRALECYR